VILSKGILAGLPWVEPKIGTSAPMSPTASAKPDFFGGSLIFRQESIKALLRTLSARDPYTGYHSNRVTNIALRFGRSLGLSAPELETLSNAGYLHDIGKIGVSDSILLKPGPLTPEERAIIETHPLIGEKIVEPLDFTSQEKDLILLHHEHWNGQGYPHGLSGPRIPFLCRLLALADVFDALTSDRPYRQAFSIGAALDEIEAQAGCQFDPDLAQRFVHLVRKLGSYSLAQIPPPPWLGRQ
jgi:HD-GYP domain-containing protein (c-di-GMP phosphodiesterase class II)